MHNQGPDGSPSGYVCPECGGALWKHGEDGSPAFECRIGHRFEAALLWVEHCAARNRAIRSAARALAENAALARELAVWTRGQGNGAAAARLEEEAVEEDRLSDQVRRMAQDLPEAADGASV